MTWLPLGRAVSLVGDRAVHEAFSIGLEAIEGQRGTLVAEPSTDYEGDGIAFLPGDVLFGKLRPYLAKAWCADRPGAAVGDFHVYRPLPGVDGRYINYVLLSHDFLDPVVASVQGAKMPRVDWGTTRSVAVWLPQHEEQRAIADFLDEQTSRIDTLIDKQTQLIATLRERRTAGIDWSLSAANGTTVRLRRLYTVSADANAPTEEVLSVYRDFGVIPKSSRNDNFNKTPENIDRYLLVRPGDLVVNRMKAWQGSLGVSSHRGIVSGDYEVLRPRDERLLPAYAHYLLRSPRLVVEYRLRSTGIRPAQWRLYWESMADIDVAVPSHSDQIEAVRHLDAETARIDVLIDKTEQHIALAGERRAALITAAVTGQIDVRTAGRAARAVA